MSWKDWSYWLRGGVILSIISLFVSLSPLKWPVYIFLGALIFGTIDLEYLAFNNPNLESLDINLFGIISISIIFLFICFLAGAVVGLIIGEIKKRWRKE